MGEQRLKDSQLKLVKEVDDEHRKYVESEGGKLLGKCVLYDGVSSGQ